MYRLNAAMVIRFAQLYRRADVTDVVRHLVDLSLKAGAVSMSSNEEAAGRA